VQAEEKQGADLIFGRRPSQTRKVARCDKCHRASIFFAKVRRIVYICEFSGVVLFEPGLGGEAGTQQKLCKVITEI
jgi:ribosomal protein S27E